MRNLPGRARAGAAHDARRFGRNGRAALPDHRRRRRLVLIRAREQLRAHALEAWRAGLLAVDPQQCVRRALERRTDLDPSDPRTLVVAAGKAAAGMLRGLPSPPLRAFVLLPDGSPADSLDPDPHVVVLRGGHPWPTREGLASTRRILAATAALVAGDRLLMLLSGGASALLEAPADGLEFDDLIAAHRVLVSSGLPIAAINLVRGCLSSVKAGGLAEAAGLAHVTTLAISDVEHDDPRVIGSAPTVPACEPLAERCRHALELLREGGVALPARVQAFLAGHAHRSGEQSRASDVADYEVVASVSDARQAATRQLEAGGFQVDTIAGGDLRGDSESAARRVAGVAGRLAGRVRPSGAAEAVVFGGETTVAVPAAASGRGGRNLHLAAQVACLLRDQDGVAVVAAGTDGVDGSSRAAGAIVDGGTAARARDAGHPLEHALARFDTEAALEAAGDLVVTGPTGTNVGDLVVVVAG